MADGKKSPPAAAGSKQGSSPTKPLQQQQSKSSSPAPAAAGSTPAAKAAPIDLPEGGDDGLRTGVVKWFNPVRGFGFITPDDGSADLFVHQTSINAQGFRSLLDGELVEYVVEYGSDGRPRASAVTGPKGAYVLGANREDEGGNGSISNNYNGGSGNRGGRGRGRGMGSRGSMGGGAAGFGYGGRCFNCNELGHLARDCSVARVGCYTCGKQGHFARDCPNQS